VARLLALLLVLATSSKALAIQSFSDVDSKEEVEKQAMSLIEGDITNKLPIKGQRFRIDDNVEEITLLSLREPESKPLILVKPDGSKW